MLSEYCKCKIRVWRVRLFVRSANKRDIVNERAFVVIVYRRQDSTARCSTNLSTNAANRPLSVHRSSDEQNWLCVPTDHAHAQYNTRKHVCTVGSGAALILRVAVRRAYHLTLRRLRLPAHATDLRGIRLVRHLAKYIHVHVTLPSVRACNGIVFLNSMPPIDEWLVC